MLSIIKRPIRPNSPCGNCKRQLIGEVWIAIVFDDLHEIPDALRSGDINMIECTFCGYRSYLWPGFLCMDRGRRRVVSALIEVEPIERYLDDLHNSLETVRDDGIELAGLDLDSAHACVGDYKQLIEVLTEPDEQFAFDAVTWAEFVERAALPDLPARAARLFAQAEQSGSLSIQLRGKEYSPEFARLVADEAERFEQTLDPGDSRRETLARTASMMREWMEKMRPRRERDKMDSVIEVALEVAPNARTMGFTAPAPELYDLADALAKQARLSATDPVRAALIEPILAIRDLLPRLIFPEPVAAAAEAPPWLESFWESSPLRELEGRVADANGQVLSFRDVAELAAAGVPHLLVFLVERYFEFARHLPPEDPAFASAISFFCAVSADNGSPEAFFGSVSLAAHLFDYCLGDREGAARLHAIGLRALDRSYQHYGAFGSHDRVMLMIAVAWESLARRAGRQGDARLSALCGNVAEQLFGEVKREDGRLSARLKAAEGLIRLGHFSKQQLLELESEIRAELARDGADKGNIGNLLSQCLFLRARLEFDEAFPFTVLVRAIDPPDPSDQLLFENDKIVIFEDGRIFSSPDRTAPPGYQGAPIDFPKGAAVAAFTADGRAISQFPDRVEGVIQFLCKAEPGSIPYIYGVNVVGCPWIDTLNEVFGLAEADSELPDDSWANAALFFAELIGRFCDPGLVRYFVSVFDLFAPMKGRDLSGHLAIRLLDLQARIKQRAMAGGQLGGPAIERRLGRIDMLLGDDPAGKLVSASAIELSFGLDLASSLFEAAGDLDRAVELQLLCCRTLFDRRRDGLPESYGQENLALSRPAYRTARILGRALGGNKPGLAARCVEFGELSKVQSQRLALSSLTDQADEAGNDVEHVLRYLPVRLASLDRLVARDTAFLHFSLLHRSNFNDGYWLASLLLPGDPEPVRAWRIEFHPLYDLCMALEERSTRAAEAIVGSNLGDAASLLAEERPAYDRVLGDLAEMLVPELLRSKIDAEEISRVFVVPEAYLCDLPWAALLDTIKGDVAAARPGPAISLLPCLAVLDVKRRGAVNMHFAKPTRFRAVLASSVPWRSGLAQIYGVERRLRDAIGLVTEGEDIFASPTVEGLVTALRDSETLLYFGHGEVASTGASVLLEDGVLGAPEVDALLYLRTRVAIIMACSGIDSAPHGLGRELSGIHMAMVRGGVRAVIGSTVPMLPAVALKLVEHLLPSLEAGARADQALALARNRIRDDPRTAHPFFWGYVSCFGDGSASWNESEGSQQA